MEKPNLSTFFTFFSLALIREKKVKNWKIRFFHILFETISILMTNSSCLWKFGISGLKYFLIDNPFALHCNGSHYIIAVIYSCYKNLI